ncbi:hypothetical protein ACHWQZ_G011968, partial [Mnemiopsis leidyi]
MAIAIVANGTQPLAPMAIETTIGTTDLIAISAIGTSICSIEWIHWRQWRQLPHSPNYM